MRGTGQIPSGHLNTMSGRNGFAVSKEAKQDFCLQEMHEWGAWLWGVFQETSSLQIQVLLERNFPCASAPGGRGLVPHCWDERGSAHTLEDACSILPDPIKDSESLAVLSTVEHSAYWHRTADNWLERNFFRAYTPPPPTLTVPESPKKV